jgi:hypothetical protein
MMSRHGHVEVAFEERDLSTKMPECAKWVACALSQGWRFVQDGSANLIDAYVGPKHVQDFKRARRQDLQRVLTFRFVGVTREVEGELISVNAFLHRCQQDRRYFTLAQAHPKFQRKLELLYKHFANQGIHFDAKDGNEAHNRRLIVPAFGGELDVIHQLAKQYENGFS